MNRFLLALCILFFPLSLIAQKQTYSIGFLFDELNPEYSTLLDELKKEIIAVVGEDANLEFKPENELMNHFDLENAKNNYESLLSRVDIIVSRGIFDAIILEEQDNFPKPTMIVGGIKQELTNFNLDNATSGVHNLHYIVTSSSFKNDLQQFKKLAEFKNLGIVFEKPILDVIEIDKIFDKIAQDIGIDYKLIPFDNITDITNNLGGVDAIYIASGYTLSTNEVKELAQAFINHKLPSFSALRSSDVANGILATNMTDEDFKKFIRRIALRIEAYIDGIDFSDQPVYIDSNDELIFNYNTSQAIGLALRYSLIEQTSFIGDLNNNASVDKTYDLPMVINEVMLKNLQLQSSKKNVELSDQEVKLAKSNYLPSVVANGNGIYIDPKIAERSLGQNPEFSTTGNVTFQQLLYSETASANIDIQKSLVKLQQEQFNSEQLDIIFNASNAYFNILILKSNLDIQLRNLELTKRNLSIAEENFNAGQSGKTDLLRFRSQKAQNTQTMIEAVNQLATGYVVINQILNNDPNTKIDVKEAFLDDDIYQRYNYKGFIELLDNPKLREPLTDFLIEEALNNAPELKQLSFANEATERQIKLYGGGRFVPTLSLLGQYNYEFSRSGAGSDYPLGLMPPEGYYNVGVNLALPIFNQNTNKIGKQTSIIQKEQLLVDTENAKLGIASNVRNTVLNIINQISNIELSKVSEASAREALDLTQNAYSSGAVNIVQLLDAQNNYLNAQLVRANATYNYLIGMLQLERAMGYYFILDPNDNGNFRQRFLEYLNKRN